MVDLDELSPTERAQELLRRLGTESSTQLNPLTNGFKQYEDLIPEVEPEPKSKEDQEIDLVLDRIDIREAYIRLIGKMTPDMRTDRVEGIKISCPLPNHPDKDPSAWINSKDKVWFCGGCQIGGDIYDLAAIKFGYDLNTYKTRENFPKLRRQLAEEYGFRYVRGITGKTYIHPPPDLPIISPSSEPEQEKVVEHEQNSGLTTDNLAKVISITRDDDSTETFLDKARIDWEKIAPPDTFLDLWMKACTINHLPHEYYFWIGLQALGFAAGRKVWLRDTPNVRPNLFVCLYGSTGVGKSTSLHPYIELLQSVLSFKEDKYSEPSGVKLIPMPGSAEALLDSFVYTIYDPSSDAPAKQASIMGLLKIEELSGFIAKASRPGSTLKDVLIDIYDGHHHLTSHTRSKGKVTANAPFGQVVSTTQPKSIHNFLRKSDAESGFLNRWVIAAGPSRMEPKSYGETPIDITYAENAFRDILVWSLTKREFILTGDSYDAWDDFFQNHIARFKTGKDELDSIASRIDLTLKKVIVLLTVNERLDQPTADIVKRAVSLYDYLRSVYNMFSQDIAFSEVTECQDKIVATIQQIQERNKKYPTRRDITRVLGRKFNTDIQVRAFRHLVELDIIEELPPESGKAGLTRYKHA